MRGATCFSGIGAPECAAPDVDWLWSADVEPFPNAVRAYHWPQVMNLGDVTAPDFLERAQASGPLDLLLGGPPCQDFSIAGLRAGLAGTRGNLTLRWLEIIHALRPAFCLTENVPGWLTVNGGHAFSEFLTGLVGHDTAIVPPRECGGRWTNAGMVAGRLGRAAWRTLDAQYFGLAQRRQRVFVVFCPGDEADPAQVLLERKGVCGNTAPGRETGQDVAPPITRGSPGGRTYGLDADTAEGVIAYGGGASDIAHTLRADGFDAGEDGTGRGTPLVPIAFPANLSGTQCASSVDIAGALGSLNPTAITVGYAVRRITPREADRLQGFPDDHGLIPWRGKPAADGLRYKAIGNSMAVPVIRWIIDRIATQHTASARAVSRRAPEAREGSSSLDSGRAVTSPAPFLEEAS